MYKYKLKSVILFLISISASIGSLVFFHHLAPFIYQTNDDLFLRTIVSGEVTGTPEPRMLFIGYPTGLFLSLCYRLFPSFPWYGILLCLGIALSFCLVLYKILQMESSSSARFITLALFFLIVYSFLFLHIAELQFTFVTSCVGASGLFWYACTPISARVRDTLRSHAAFLLMSAFSFCIRDNAFLMLLPFWGILSLQKLLCECRPDPEKEYTKNFLVLCACFLSIIGLFYGINRAAYTSPEWKSFLNFSASRSSVLDYSGLPDYDTAHTVYESGGINRASYEGMQRYSFLVDPAINESSMKLLADYNARQNAITLQTLPSKLKKMASSFLDRSLGYTDRPLNILVYMLYLFFFIIALISHNKPVLTGIFLTVAARMTIWIYLLYLDRVPVRVTQGIYFAEFLLLISLAFRYKLWYTEAHAKLIKGCWYITVIIVVFLCFRFGIPKARAAAYESTGIYNYSKAFSELKEYFADHHDNFYYLDMDSFTYFSEDAFATAKTDYANYILMGSWLPKSPWYAKKLARENITDPGRALYEDPHVYVVFLKYETTTPQYLQYFYAENHGGKRLTVIEEITVSGDLVYQIMKVTD